MNSDLISCVYIYVLACYRCIDVRTIFYWMKLIMCHVTCGTTIVIGGVRLARLAFKVHMRAVHQETG
jgi:hypothetical protein